MNSLEKLIEHFIVNLFGTSTVQLGNFILVGAVWVESSELAAGIPEQYQKMFTLGPVDFFKDAPLRLLVHNTGENAIFNRIQHYAAVRFRRGLFVQSRS